MQQLADLPTEMSTDSGKIEALKMQARVVDVPVERQTLSASSSRTEEWLLEAYEPPELPEHLESKR